MAQMARNSLLLLLALSVTGKLHGCTLSSTQAFAITPDIRFLSRLIQCFDFSYSFYQTHTLPIQSPCNCNFNHDSSNPSLLLVTMTHASVK